MSTRRTILTVAALTTLLFAGCGSSGDSTGDASGEQGGADSGSSPAVAQLGDGTEFYQYIPKKKPTNPELVEVKPTPVGDEKFRFPPQAKAPEVIADVRVFSDKSFQFDGKFEEYRSDGKTPHTVGGFKNDRRDGKWTYYHPNGKVAKEMTYVDGQLEGTWTHFGADGSKNLDATYKNGKRAGTWSNYAPPDKDGKQAVVQTMDYVDGLVDGSQIQLYPNGKKRIERQFKAGRQHGKQTAWYENGTVASEAIYERGVAHGMHTMWDDKGKVVTQREYRHGKPLRNDKDEIAKVKPEASPVVPQTPPSAAGQP